MRDYALYLESGPQRKTTMAHVIELLGCHVRRKTTDETVADAPDAIRRWLQFFAERGEPFDAADAFTTHVEIHITDGSWLGNGDPTSGFAPDFEPIAMAEVEIHLRRLGQVHDHIVELTHDLGALPGVGFPLSRLLRHIGAAEAEFVRCSLDKPDDLRTAVKVMQADDDTLLESLQASWKLASDRVAAATPEELARQTQRGQKTWTVRRTLRRMLEHTWEHMREIEDRLEGS